MMAKMILPMLGGTPAVWNTCMLFYQAALLGGYGYVHAITSVIDPRRQVLLHVILLAVPLALLPIGLPAGWTPPDQASPIVWVLLLLAVAIGFPFFMLSTTAPLLQRWFSWTNHPSASDPYFLYAASNAGSMLALLGYPLFIEPWLPLRGAGGMTQTRLWSVGYGVLVALIGFCAWYVRRAGTGAETTVLSGKSQPETSAPSPISAITKVQWILLAFIPSSLLLGVTTHITLNVAAIPLLWVIPLALYLLSFIVVFAKWTSAQHRAMVLAAPLVLMLLVFDMLPDAPALPHWMQLLFPLVGLGVVALVCHGELARTRPSTDHLTLFYLLMSIGGALGGLFNALVAPLAFKDIYEYELIVVCACAVLPKLEATDPLVLARWSPYRWSRSRGYLQNGAWMVALMVSAGLSAWLLNWLNDPSDLLAAFCTVLILLVCYSFVGRSSYLGASLAVVLAVSYFVSARFSAEVLYQTRTFFGVLKVEHKKERNTRKLLHGTINHGVQRMEPEARRESVSYFHPTGPYGQVFAAFSGPNRKERIAVTGLGIAALANYAEQGQSLTYYEIDPEVVWIAQNPRLFTYYDDAKSRGVELQVVVGDARLKMEAAPDGAYDMVILDAFTSDAIPVHLLTREAMEMYLRKLAPDGLLVVHISNRYLALEPVLGNLSQALGLVALKQFDLAKGVPFKSASDLVVMARRTEALGPLAADQRWTPVKRDPAVGIWSDDYSNVLSIFRWGD